MGQSGGQRYGVRLLLIFAVIFAVVAIAVAAVLLTRDVQLSWALWPVLHLLLTGIMIVLSGVSISGLVYVVWFIWRMDPDKDFTVRRLLKKLKSKQPLRWIAVVAVALLVGVGVYLGPRGLERGNLVIMAAFPADPEDARTMLLEQWNRLNPNNQAKFDFVALSHDDQHARMVNDAKPGGAHEADIYVLDIVWMPEFIDRGYIRQLDESRLPADDQGDFVPKILETCEDESGNLWALPFNSDVGLTHLRADIPGLVDMKNWEDYSGVPARNKVDGHPGVEAATAAQLAVNDEMLTISTLEAIWAAGGEVVGPNGQVTMNADESEVIFGPLDVTGLGELAVAFHDPKIALQVENADAASRAFADGRTLYMRNWPVARDNIGTNVPFVAVAPPHPSVLGGQNLAISAETDKERAAQALIQFLTSAASQQILSEVGGFVPTRESAFTNARRPDMEQIESALDDARLRPVTPCYVEFSQRFRLGVRRTLQAKGQLEEGFARDLARILRCP